MRKSLDIIACVAGLAYRAVNKGKPRLGWLRNRGVRARPTPVPWAADRLTPGSFVVRASARIFVPTEGYGLKPALRTKAPRSGRLSPAHATQPANQQNIEIARLDPPP